MWTSLTYPHVRSSLQLGFRSSAQTETIGLSFKL